MKSECKVRDCLQCTRMREMIKTKRTGLKYEVYCEIDNRLKGRVTGVFDTLSPQECPLNKKSRSNKKRRNIISFFKK